MDQVTSSENLPTYSTALSTSGKLGWTRDRRGRDSRPSPEEEEGRSGTWGREGRNPGVSRGPLRRGTGRLSGERGVGTETPTQRLPSPPFLTLLLSQNLLKSLPLRSFLDQRTRSGAPRPHSSSFSTKTFETLLHVPLSRSDLWFRFQSPSTLGSGTSRQEGPRVGGSGTWTCGDVSTVSCPGAPGGPFRKFALHPSTPELRRPQTGKVVRGSPTVGGPLSRWFQGCVGLHGAQPKTERSRDGWEWTRRRDRRWVGRRGQGWEGGR